MKTEKTISISMLVLCLLGGLLIGFSVGRSTISQDVEYIAGKTIRDTIEVEKLVPYQEEIPTDPKLPIKDVESEMPIVDSAAIIRSYIAKRDYRILAFDNKEHGRLEFFPSVQYNGLIGLDYSFTPMQRQIYKQRVWQAFAAISYSTLNYVGVGGGLFYHNLGFEYQYQMGYGGLGRGHSFGLKYKF